MSPATLHHLWPFWLALEDALAEESLCWPWDSEDPEVQACWERLTHPDNLTALRDWAKDFNMFQEYVKVCTRRALADCEERAVS
jgi:hypothetical protein